MLPLMQIALEHRQLYSPFHSSSHPSLSSPRGSVSSANHPEISSDDSCNQNTAVGATKRRFVISISPNYAGIIRLDEKEAEEDKDAFLISAGAASRRMQQREETMNDESKTAQRQSFIRHRHRERKPNAGFCLRCFAV